ncbi:MAG: zf-TFIIB domain-containing protein [Deltaproteobacteria bacterium]|nr:zf-TFIIB domain-containing protein [Deltaproteobacteria bacterium]
MDCPRCRTPLTLQQAPRLAMHCCFSCGGLFLDGDASRRVVDSVDPSAIAAADQVARSAQRPVPTEATAPCPACARPLDRMPIPAAGVTVDVCREHGVWFDRDELQRVVRAVAPERTTPVPMAPATPSQGAMQPIPGAPMQPMAAPMQPLAGAPMQPTAAPMQPAAPLSPGMAPGQYVAPGWLEEGAQKPFGGGPSFGSPQGGAPPSGPGAPLGGGAPAAPGQGWSTAKTAVAVGAGVAAVAGVAYAASHTNLGRQVMGVGPHASGFGAIGQALSRLF